MELLEYKSFLELQFYFILSFPIVISYKKILFLFLFLIDFSYKKIFRNRYLAAEKPCFSFGIYYTSRDHNSICLWWGQVPCCTRISCRWAQGQYKLKLTVHLFMRALRELRFRCLRWSSNYKADIALCGHRQKITPYNDLGYGYSILVHVPVSVSYLILIPDI